jgi:hypothetical protein
MGHICSIQESALWWAMPVLSLKTTDAGMT